MLRRYELTDQEWEQVAALLPPEKTGKPGRPPKDNRPFRTDAAGKTDMGYGENMLL